MGIKWAPANTDKRKSIEKNCNTFLTSMSFNGEFEHDNSNSNIVVKLPNMFSEHINQWVGDDRFSYVCL